MSYSKNIFLVIKLNIITIIVANILTIKGADFSGSGLGTNTSMSISYIGNVTGTPGYIEKNKQLTSTITIKTGYTYNSITSVTVGGSTITGYTPINNGDGTVTLTIPAEKITGKVVINVSTTATGGGETGGDSEGDSEQPGTGGDTPVINHPQPSGDSIPQNGIVTENMFVVLENTWINGSGLQLDQKLNNEDGNTIGYFTAYLPIDISGYTNIDMTAQTNAATYYQFFKQDGSWSLTGTRVKIDKGTTSNEISIPSGAKYLIVASHRTNSTDAAAVDGYLKYFPQSIKIY